MKLSYRSTLVAGYVGYVTQAISINFSPLLFVTFRNQYDLSLTQISALIVVCFCIQMAADAATVRFPNLFRPRPTAVLAHLCAAVGVAGFGIFPRIMPPFWGLLVATLISGAGSGLVEVMITPIVESCPTDKKSANMCLLHSFYCWGQAGVIILSSLFFLCFGVEKWPILALLWALVPTVGAILFSMVPLYPIGDPVANQKQPRAFLKNGLFWAIVVMMISSGAAEITMSQWASTFAETGLGVDKTFGDLLGPGLFAILMGLARVFYAKFSEKISLSKYMAVCGCLCIASYLLASLAPASAPILSLFGCALCGLSVGIMWPGNISNAAGLLPGSGLSMFAFLALSGDIGCLLGPAVAGTVADAFGGNIRISFLFSILYPVILLGALAYLKAHSKSTRPERGKEQL